MSGDNGWLRTVWRGGKHTEDVGREVERRDDEFRHEKSRHVA